MIVNVPLVNDSVSKEVRAENEKRGMIYYQMVKHAVKNGLDKETYARRSVNRIGRDNAKQQFSEFTNIPEFAFSFINEYRISQFRPELKQMTDDEAMIEFHYCPMLGGLMNMTDDGEELELLCDCAMESDRGLADEIGIDFILGGTIAKGDATCQLCFREKGADNER